ncbi:MAG: acyl-CoA reductase [Bacteroidia bacterium]
MAPSSFLKNRILAIAQLSQFYRSMLNDEDHPVWFRCSQENAFFTEDSIRLALATWADALTVEGLEAWLLPYEIQENSEKVVGVVAAGNLPLVGLHDALCVLLSGFKLQLKPSSSDRYLMVETLQFLEQLPEFSGRIALVEKLSEYHQVIATGSNNTNRYFEVYFRNVPALLRGHRNSVAILTGNETKEDLTNLGHDVFTYFGLGCRSISKLLVPRGYSFNALFEAWEHFAEIKNHFKYFNNYEYHLAGYLVNQIPFLSNDWVIIKEDDAWSSPIGVVYYSYYDSLEEANTIIQQHEGKIQCVVGQGYFPLGSAQFPQLNDYADGVDTISFLLA